MIVMSEVTQILCKIERGESAASAELLPLVYDELRRLASQKMSAENQGQTLQATALVHEAYVRLVDAPQAQSWESRGHFFAAAAEAMRRILIENARRKRGPKAGGDMQRHDISLVEPESEESSVDLLELDEALRRLAEKDPRTKELVMLRFFAGLTNEQAAEVLGISARTATADWGYAKAWLRVELGPDSDAR